MKPKLQWSINYVNNKYTPPPRKHQKQYWIIVNNGGVYGLFSAVLGHIHHQLLFICDGEILGDRGGGVQKYFTD